MKRIAPCIAAILAAVACPLIVFAGPASATPSPDPSEFFEDLDTFGFPQKTPAERQAALEVGYTVCRHFASGKSLLAVDDILMKPPTSWSSEKAAAWAVAARELCPR